MIDRMPVDVIRSNPQKEAWRGLPPASARTTGDDILFRVSLPDGRRCGSGNSQEAHRTGHRSAMNTHKKDRRQHSWECGRWQRTTIDRSFNVYATFELSTNVWSFARSTWCTFWSIDMAQDGTHVLSAREMRGVINTEHTSRGGKASRHLSGARRTSQAHTTYMIVTKLYMHTQRERDTTIMRTTSPAVIAFGSFDSNARHTHTNIVFRNATQIKPHRRTTT